MRELWNVLAIASGLAILVDNNKVTSCRQLAIETKNFQCLGGKITTLYCSWNMINVYRKPGFPGQDFMDEMRKLLTKMLGRSSLLIVVWIWGWRDCSKLLPQCFSNCCPLKIWDNMWVLRHKNREGLWTLRFVQIWHAAYVGQRQHVVLWRMQHFVGFQVQWHLLYWGKDHAVKHRFECHVNFGVVESPRLSARCGGMCIIFDKTCLKYRELTIRTSYFQCVGVKLSIRFRQFTSWVYMEYGRQPVSLAMARFLLRGNLADFLIEKGWKSLMNKKLKWSAYQTAKKVLR